MNIIFEIVGVAVCAIVAFAFVGNVAGWWKITLTVEKNESE